MALEAEPVVASELVDLDIELDDLLRPPPY